MKTGRSLFLALGAFVLSSASGVSQIPIKPSSVEGTVLDAMTGVALRGAIINSPLPTATLVEDLISGKARSPGVESGADGHFLLENLSDGATTIDVVQPGYMARRLYFGLVAGERVKDVVVRLTPMGVASGRVLNHGQPAVGVFVSAFRYRYTSTGARELIRAGSRVRTNDLGEFRLFNLVPDDYFILFSQSSGNPFLPTPGAAAGPTAAFPVPYQGLPVLYPGVGTLSTAEMINVKRGEETRLNTVALGPNRFAALRIHLINDSGESSKDAEFAVAYVTQGYQGNGVADLGTSPGLVPVRVEPGPGLLREYWPATPGLFIAHLRWKDSQGEISYLVTPIEFSGSDVDISIPMAKPEGRLNIHVLKELPDGTSLPVAGASIGLCRATTSACASSSAWISSGPGTGREYSQVSPVSDVKGAVNLVGIPEGQYELYSLNPFAAPLDLGALQDPWRDIYIASIRQGGRNALQDGIVVSKNSDTLEIRVRSNPGSLLGRVVDRQGHAVINSFVAVLPEPPMDAVRLSNLRRFTRTDQSGAFELRGIAPGDYRVYAWPAVVDNTYLNGAFAASFKENASRIHVEEGSQSSLDLKLLNEPSP